MAFLCTMIDVAQRMSERGVSLRLDDNPRAITQCIREACNRVLMDLMPIYTQSALLQDALTGGMDANGGMTRDLATDLSVCKVAARRGNTVAATFKDICKESKELLKNLSDNPDQYQLPNVPMAQPHSPTFSNMRIIPGYIYTQARVEVTISDLPPTSPGYAQKIDWFSAFYIEY